MSTWTFHDKKDSQGKARDYIAMMRFMRKGQVARDRQWIEGFLAEDPVNRFIIVAYGRVYDVSTYMAPGSKARFLGTTLPIRTFLIFKKELIVDIRGQYAEDFLVLWIIWR